MPQFYGSDTYGAGSYGEFTAPAPAPPSPPIAAVVADTDDQEVLAPPSESFRDAVYAQMAPAASVDSNGDLLKLVGGFGQLFQELDDMARSQGEHLPWTQLLDIDRIPDNGVAWLGQLLGVTPNNSLTIHEQRQRIRDHAGWQRGTPRTMMNLIRPYLSGTRTIEIRERNPDPYSFQIATYESETPKDRTYQDEYNDFASYYILLGNVNSYRKLWLLSGPNILNDILQANKPAGLVLHLVVRGEQDYYDVLTNFARYADVYGAFATYLDVLNYVAPGITQTRLISFFQSFTGYLQELEAYQDYDVLYANNDQY